MTAVVSQRDIRAFFAPRWEPRWRAVIGAFAFTCALALLGAEASADSTDVYHHSFSAEWGTSYFGNMLRLSTMHGVGRRFAVGLGYSRGGVSIDAASGSSFYSTGAYVGELSMDIGLSDVFDLSMYYLRLRDRQWKWLGAAGLGIAHYRATWTLTELVDNGYEQYVATGSKQLAEYATCASIDIIEYRPEAEGGFSVCVGSRAYLTRIMLPQRITVAAGSHHETLVMTCGDHQYYYLIYPELTVRFKYGF
ncbi:hypothetical protein EG831_01355 [bacterium]|nr:hypothetical protein [bacterium]